MDAYREGLKRDCISQIHAYLEANSDRNQLLEYAVKITQDMIDQDLDAYQICFNLTQFFLGGLKAVGEATEARTKQETNEDAYLYSCAIVKIWDTYREHYHMKGMN